MRLVLLRVSPVDVAAIGLLGYCCLHRGAQTHGGGSVGVNQAPCSSHPKWKLG